MILMFLWDKFFPKCKKKKQHWELIPSIKHKSVLTYINKNFYIIFTHFLLLGVFDKPAFSSLPP